MQKNPNEIVRGFVRDGEVRVKGGSGAKGSEYTAVIEDGGSHVVSHRGRNKEPAAVTKRWGTSSKARVFTAPAGLTVGTEASGEVVVAAGGKALSRGVCSSGVCLTQRGSFRGHRSALSSKQRWPKRRLLEWWR